MSGSAPTSGYAPVNGLNLYYEIHGDGDPLVLLHGAMSAIGTSFGALLPGLAATRRCCWSARWRGTRSIACWSPIRWPR